MAGQSPRRIIPSPSVLLRSRGTQLWHDPEACGLPLLTLFIDAFGTEALQWSPITMVMEIRDEFASSTMGEQSSGPPSEIHPAAFERLMAAVRILTTDDFFRSVPDFIRICLALQGESEGGFLADVEDCAWGVTEAVLIAAPDNVGADLFSDQVRAYIAHVLASEGLADAPESLKWAVGDKDEGGARLSSISSDFADDPEMFLMISGTQKDRKDAVDRYVKNRMLTLVDQLESLPLRNGSKKGLADFTKKLAEKLGRSDKEQSVMPSERSGATRNFSL